LVKSWTWSPIAAPADRTLAECTPAKPAKWLLIAFLALEAVLIWTYARDRLARRIFWRVSATWFRWM